MPGRLILTTVGTSTFEQSKLDRIGLLSRYQNLKRGLRRLPIRKLYGWIENHTSFPQADSFIEAYIETMRRRYNVADEVGKPAQGTGINVFSAEMTSLHLMYEDLHRKYEDQDLELNLEQDKIIFLLSESPKGVLAGIINQRLLAEGDYLQGQSMPAELTIVPGLQMENFQLFFSQGLQAFVNCIRDAAKASPTKEPLLNITGGFKSLVAYSAYFSLAFQIPMVFAFEESTEIVEIQPPWVNLSPGQREQLIGGIQQVVAETLGLEPDAFDLT